MATDLRYPFCDRSRAEISKCKNVSVLTLLGLVTVLVLYSYLHSSALKKKWSFAELFWVLQHVQNHLIVLYNTTKP